MCFKFLPVFDINFGNHIGRRPSLGVKALCCHGSERKTSDHCQSNFMFAEHHSSFCASQIALVFMIPRRLKAENAHNVTGHLQSASIGPRGLHLAGGRLQPHRVQQFKLSNDPKFIDKLRDVVGLYVDPPAHAIVLSVDEKSQIQALSHQPGLPMKKGRAGTMTHDYKRHGTTTLFAALDVLEGKVIGRCMQRHRHQEFIRFLNAIEAQVPARKTVHVILDNYAAHKHPKVANGSTATRASPSTSPRPPARGSTPSRGSSPNSPSGGSSAASSMCRRSPSIPTVMAAATTVSRLGRTTPLQSSVSGMRHCALWRRQPSPVPREHGKQKKAPSNRHFSRPAAKFNGFPGKASDHRAAINKLRYVDAGHQPSPGRDDWQPVLSSPRTPTFLPTVPDDRHPGEMRFLVGAWSWPPRAELGILEKPD